MKNHIWSIVFDKFIQGLSEAHILRDELELSQGPQPLQIIVRSLTGKIIQNNNLYSHRKQTCGQIAADESASSGH